MSISIVNGYKLPNMSVLELRRFCSELQERIKPTVAQYKGIVIATIATKVIDILHASPDMVESMIDEMNIQDDNEVILVAKLYATNQHRQVRLSGIRNPMFDLSCELIFIPIEGAILALLYTEHHHFAQVVHNHPLTQEYIYFDGGDKPDDISTKDWNQRRKDWTEAMADHDVAPMAGFSIQLIGLELFDTPLSEVLKHVPITEVRAYSTARRKLTDTYVNQGLAADATNEDIYTKHEEVSAWLDGDAEGMSILRNEVERVMPLLPEITSDLLSSKIGDIR